MEQPRLYNFSNFRPHAENPISNETYNELDRIVGEVNESLGICEQDLHYAYSPPTASEPAISLVRHEIPGGSTLGITLQDESGNTTSMTARNDAGTFLRPHQSAAEIIEQNSSHLATRMDSSISATEFEPMLDMVKRRAESQGFEKKRRMLHILAIAS